MKSGSRIAAFDESFSRNDRESLVMGVIGRKGIVEGMLSFRVHVDGNDATSGLISAVAGSRFRDQVKAIALNGITFAGLNLIDIEKVRDSLHVPVLAMTRKRPRRSLLKLSIRQRGGAEGIEVLDRLARLISIRRSAGYYIQSIGGDYDGVKPLVGESAALLRLAHMAASAVRHGESRGRV